LYTSITGSNCEIVYSNANIDVIENNSVKLVDILKGISQEEVKDSVIKVRLWMVGSTAMSSPNAIVRMSVTYLDGTHKVFESTQIHLNVLWNFLRTEL
jgi:hypothetical protein